MNTNVLEQPTYSQTNNPNIQPYQTKRCNAAIVSIVLLLSLSGCSTMGSRDKNTAVGAGVGAVAGAVLTGGSAWGTVGGAAVGGVIGNQIGQ